MGKKRFLIVLLMMLSLMFTTLAGCSVGGTTTTSDGKESASISVSDSLPETDSEEPSEKESESQSEKESVSEIESESKQLRAPTFAIEVTSTTTSISFEAIEEDPDEVGEITAIVLKKGKEEIVVEDMSTRTIDGLLSGVSYTIYVTYTYDIGDGEVSQTYSKSKYTSALRAPTVELSYDPTSETSLSFELDIKDPSEILEINSIKLIPEDVDKHDLL